MSASRDSNATFSLEGEDHTLGNSLRFVLNRNPQVAFCGYSVPHPSEELVNVRVQTTGDLTAVQAFRDGLNDLSGICDVIEEEFKRKSEAFSSGDQVAAMETDK